MSSLFPLEGSKSYLDRSILQQCPAHVCWAEPFAGSLALLWAKSKSKVECVADINQDIVYFYQALRDSGSNQAMMEAFQWQCMNLPDSRELYQDLFKKWHRGWRPEHPVERAAIWYFIQCLSVNGKRGWSFSPVFNKAEFWQLHVQRLPWFASRLRSVQIEHQDFRKFIPQWDRPTTLFYCDPPYVGVPGIKEYYGSGFTEQDHRDLAVILNQIAGKAIVSYYPHPLVDELYKGWHRQVIKVIKGPSAVNPGEDTLSAEELLLFNFPPLPLFANLDEEGGSDVELDG